MNLRPRKTEDPDVNITSLIDVVLMLLVFFMLSSTFVKNTDIEIKLPTSTAPPIKAENNRVTVTISAKGRYFIDGTLVANANPESLKRTLASAAKGNYQRPLTIRADARSSHQSVVTAMDVAGALGFTSLNIVTTHPATQ